MAARVEVVLNRVLTVSLRGCFGLGVYPGRVGLGSLDRHRVRFSHSDVRHLLCEAAASSIIRRWRMLCL